MWHKCIVLMSVVLAGAMLAVAQNDVPDGSLTECDLNAWTLNNASPSVTLINLVQAVETAAGIREITDIVDELELLATELEAATFPTCLADVQSSTARAAQLFADGVFGQVDGDPEADGLYLQATLRYGYVQGYLEALYDVYGEVETASNG